jgi:hypothetical protein
MFFSNIAKELYQNKKSCIFRCATYHRIPHKSLCFSILEGIISEDNSVCRANNFYQTKLAVSKKSLLRRLNLNCSIANFEDLNRKRVFFTA